jgi:hypothetical protein
VGTIGIRRTFLDTDYRHLPNALSAFAEHFFTSQDSVLGFVQAKSRLGRKAYKAIYKALSV